MSTISDRYPFKPSKKAGRLGVDVPYNGEFVAELKLMVPNASWSDPCWFFNELDQDTVRGLVNKYYPPEDQLQKVRIEWDLNRDDPTIDGASLCSFSRDHWNWRKNCSVEFKVVEASELSSGGSRDNPGMFGKLVIEAKIRPGAVIKPAAEVTVLEEGQPTQADPLPEVDTETLIAAIEARGYMVCAK